MTSFQLYAQNMPQNSPEGHKPVGPLATCSSFVGYRSSNFTGEFLVSVENCRYLVFLYPIKAIGDAKQRAKYLWPIVVWAECRSDVCCGDHRIGIPLQKEIPQILPLLGENAELAQQLQRGAEATQCGGAVQLNIGQASNRVDCILSLRFCDLREPVFCLLGTFIVL